jgi:hypothetical protein
MRMVTGTRSPGTGSFPLSGCGIVCMIAYDLHLNVICDL